MRTGGRASFGEPYLYSFCWRWRIRLKNKNGLWLFTRNELSLTKEISVTLISVVQQRVLERYLIQRPSMRQAGALTIGFGSSSTWLLNKEISTECLAEIWSRDRPSSCNLTKPAKGTLKYCRVKMSSYLWIERSGLCLKQKSEIKFCTKKFRQKNAFMRKEQQSKFFVWKK